jgi:hypothetical protein
MNPLDDLISGALGDSTLSRVPLNEPSETQSETHEVEKITNVSPQGEITSTCKITFTTVRAVRRRYATNVTDEEIGALIEAAQSEVFPKIKDCSGDELQKMIIYHQECARIIQAVLIEHVRQAHIQNAPVKVTRAELEALREKAKKERETKLAHKGKASKREKTQLEKAKKGEETPLFEKLLKSTDASQRSAGKFIKSQMTMGISEIAALKNWNNICAMSNNATGMVLNISGKRLDEVIKEKDKK